MSLTTDPHDPRLGRGGPQHEAYLILSDEERAKGFVRPLRRMYIHVGKRPKHPLRDLTPGEKEQYSKFGYIKFEKYPESESPVTGRFWTHEDLNACGKNTTMALPLCETYARQPDFYGATFCAHCRKHLPVSEFRWLEADGSLGPVVGS